MLKLSEIPINIHELIGAKEYKMVSTSRFDYISFYGHENSTVCGTIIFDSETEEMINANWVNKEWKNNDKMPLTEYDEIEMRFNWFCAFGEEMTKELYQKVIEIAKLRQKRIAEEKLEARRELEKLDLLNRGTVKLRKPLKPVGIRSGLQDAVKFAYREQERILKIKEMEERCTCDNPLYGFNCVCDHVKENPGSNSYSCEFCGLYQASKPACSNCIKD